MDGLATLAVARRAVERAVARFGGLDVLVNNAGIAQTEQHDTWDAPEEAWDRVIRVNLRSVYACSRAAIPMMLERGKGWVVSVASIAASVCVKGGLLQHTDRGRASNR